MHRRRLVTQVGDQDPSDPAVGIDQREWKATAVPCPDFGTELAMRSTRFVAGSIRARVRLPGTGKPVHEQAPPRWRRPRSILAVILLAGSIRTVGPRRRSIQTDRLPSACPSWPMSHLIVATTLSSTDRSAPRTAPSRRPIPRRPAAMPRGPVVPVADFDRRLDRSRASLRPARSRRILSAHTVPSRLAISSGLPATSPIRSCASWLHRTGGGTGGSR